MTRGLAVPVYRKYAASLTVLEVIDLDVYAAFRGHPATKEMVSAIVYFVPWPAATIADA